MRIIVLATASFLLLAPAVAAADSLSGLSGLSGKWELQSLGADRDFKVVQQGKQLTAYRLMWPEFEGKRYRLEHLYRGTIRGKSITGKLLVKEEELPRFEVLRAFTGKVDSATAITLDGLPLKLVASKATAQAGRAGKPAAGLQLDTVGSLVTPTLGFNRLVAEGDAHFARRRYDKALRAYNDARVQRRYGGIPPTLLHRMGRCHLALKRWGPARRYLSWAIRLDPANKSLKQDYERARRGT